MGGAAVLRTEEVIMSTHEVGKFYRSKRTVSSQIESENTPADRSIKEAIRVDSERRTEHAETIVHPRGPSKPKKCCLVPEALWKVFPRQQMAFEFSHRCYQNSAVFSFESEEFGREGQRKYLVTTYYEFGQRYLSMKCPRHYYEVITEDSACRLYFDIEFKKELNPQVNGISLLEVFIKYLCYQLCTCFGLACGRSNILDLESSTPYKFSRHLVFHLPSSSFRNNIHTGHFVHYCCEKLRSFKSWIESGTPVQQAYEQSFPSPAKQKTVLTRNQKGVKQLPTCPSDHWLYVNVTAFNETNVCLTFWLVCSSDEAMDLKSLFILNEHGKEVLLVDEGVYTRNRNFRLFLSSKLGKDVPLVVSKENEFRSTYGENSLKRRRSKKFNTLMDSLVCNVSYETCSRVLEFGEAALQSAGHKSHTSKTSHKESDKDAAAGFSLSPFPLVDKFITSTLTKGDTKGSIRRWTYFSQGKQLAYDIQHYRWCENINRAHKSNNVMIIADLVRGVFYQKCHDPECKRINFRSNEKPIPVECNPVANSTLDDKQSNVATCRVELDTDDLRTLVEEVSYKEVLEMEEDTMFESTKQQPAASTNPDTTRHYRDTTGHYLDTTGHYRDTTGHYLDTTGHELDTKKFRLKVENKEQCIKKLNQLTNYSAVEFDRYGNKLNVPVPIHSSNPITNDIERDCDCDNITESLLLEAMDMYEACSLPAHRNHNKGTHSGTSLENNLKLSCAESRSSKEEITGEADDVCITDYSLSAEEMESFCEDSDTF